MEHSWRFIRSPAMSGAMNMAVDEVLFRQMETNPDQPPCLRLYRWSPPTLTLGYGQRGLHTYSEQGCRNNGVDVVRRITGGRAVLHHREVTYAVIAPVKSSLFPGDILGNYRRIAQVLLAVIQKAGLKATLSEGTIKAQGSNVERQACFTAPASYEILYQGKKMTGCAQKRGENVFLQHGSIPVDMDLFLLESVLGGSGTVQKLLEKVGWLNRWCHPGVEADDVESLLVDQFERILNCRLVESSLSRKESERAQYLVRTKYSDVDWYQRGKNE